MPVNSTLSMPGSRSVRSEEAGAISNFWMSLALASRLRAANGRLP